LPSCKSIRNRCPFPHQFHPRSTSKCWWGFWFKDLHLWCSSTLIGSVYSGAHKPNEDE
jgi:hypothetical protein